MNNWMRFGMGMLAGDILAFIVGMIISVAFYHASPFGFFIFGVIAGEVLAGAIAIYGATRALS